MANTIADKLTYLDGTKTAIKNAIVAKGVDVADDAPFRQYADKILDISDDRFGLTFSNVINTLDEKGTLGTPLDIGDLRFDGVKELGYKALGGAFYRREDIVSVSFPELTKVGTSALHSAFHSCNNLASLFFPVLTEIGSSGIASGLGSCTALESVSFPALITVKQSGLNSTFGSCSSLSIVDLSAVKTVESGGMYFTFSKCLKITEVKLDSLAIVAETGLHGCFQAISTDPGVLKRIDFPSLFEVNANAFGTGMSTYIFAYRTTLEEIHFMAAVQPFVEKMAGYADKWGAANATIYFDLPNKPMA